VPHERIETIQHGTGIADQVVAAAAASVHDDETRVHALTDTPIVDQTRTKRDTTEDRTLIAKTGASDDGGLEKMPSESKRRRTGSGSGASERNGKVEKPNAPRRRSKMHGGRGWPLGRQNSGRGVGSKHWKMGQV
jgi:hypothetical protein